MGKFPVIFITLKDVEARDYKNALAMLCAVIRNEACRFRFLLESSLLGLLSHRVDWALKSNTQTGKGYSDILIKMKRISVGIVIELKYSESRNLEAACQYALKQIKEKNYADQLLDDGMTTILKYGIACRKNTCMVRMSTE